jgi:predicted sulfurtransferase
MTLGQLSIDYCCLLSKAWTRMKKIYLDCTVGEDSFRTCVDGGEGGSWIFYTLFTVFTQDSISLSIPTTVCPSRLLCFWSIENVGKLKTLHHRSIKRHRHRQPKTLFLGAAVATMATTTTTTSKEQDTDQSFHETVNELDAPKKRRRLSKRQRKTLKRKQQQQQQQQNNHPPPKKSISDHAEEFQKAKGKLQSSLLSDQRINVNDSSQKDCTEKKKNHESERCHHLPNIVQEEEDDETIRLRCMKTYVPIKIPSKVSSEVLKTTTSTAKRGKDNDTDAIADEGGCRTLGKWFPNAILVKSRINYTNTGKLILLNDDNQYNEILSEDAVRVDHPKSSLVLFYQYTTSADSSATAPWDQSQLQFLITYLTKVARRRNLGGRIRVASEGVNATISAVDTRQCTAQGALRHLAQDLQRFDPLVFQNTDFKFLDYLPADRHFKEFKIMPVQELVFYDIGDDEAPLKEQQQQQQLTKSKNGRDEGTIKGEGGGIHLEAKEYHEMLKRDNTVVIDVRNHYETILGRFVGQQQQQLLLNNNPSDGNGSNTIISSGAEYLDPKMRKSTDFKSWLATPETKNKLRNKTVLMYCTGGIRCERASAYLKQTMGNQVDGVYQLKGGIERYLKTFKDGGFWRGKNFVFDKREAVGVENPEGDGGVIRKQTKLQKNIKQSLVAKDEDKKLPAKCCVCEQVWDRYVGKKKCSTCGVPVLMCDKCMSLKPDKTPGMEFKVRCPLCVEENITVLAKEVEFTDNGIKSKKSQKGTGASESKDGDKPARGKAADSVLKWGGGHANKKKQLQKMKRRLCQFGNDCMRQDCFFYHPERETNLHRTTKT